jgi:spore maturation protein CgeB
MTEVDLNFIGNDHDHRLEAIKWLVKTYGVSDPDVWRVKGLDRIYFKNPKHATIFILKWS